MFTQRNLRWLRLPWLMSLIASAAIMAGLFAWFGPVHVTSASGPTIDWVDWTAADSSTVTGSLGGGAVTVTHTGPRMGTQLGGIGEINYWSPTGPFISATVHNAPPCCDIIQLVVVGSHTITFSSPVKDPVMALNSVGAIPVPVRYEFNIPFTILSDNSASCAFWGCGTLTDIGGNVLEGREGSGVIQFTGTFSSISWHNPNREFWHGFTIGVLDTTPPTVACSVTPNKLWPPNHKMVTVNASVSVSDAGSGPAGFTLVSVTSNEPDNGLGDGDTPNDIQGWSIGTADTSGQLRAERSGKGSGRIYTLTYQGMDQAGNSALCSATVSVPHDQGK